MGMWAPPGLSGGGAGGGQNIDLRLRSRLRVPRSTRELVHVANRVVDTGEKGMRSRRREAQRGRGVEGPSGSAQRDIGRQSSGQVVKGTRGARMDRRGSMLRRESIGLSGLTLPPT